MPIEITIDGTTRTVTKQKLLDLAAKGIIGPETTIQVNGKFWKAGQIKDIVFGSKIDDTLDLPDEIDSLPVTLAVSVRPVMDIQATASEKRR